MHNGSPSEEIAVLAAAGGRHGPLRPADVLGLVAEVIADRLGPDVSVWLDASPDPDDLEVDVGHGHHAELVIHLSGAERWTLTLARPSGEIVGTSQGEPGDVAEALTALLTTAAQD